MGEDLVEPGDGLDEEQRRLEEERVRKEAEELASFERRAAWWDQHYGGATEGAEERTRAAIEHAERLRAEGREPCDPGPGA